MTTPPNFDAQKRIEQYVKLRDKKKEIEERHKVELKPINEALELLESMLLAHLNNTNQDSASTAAGTAYKGSRTSAKIVDASLFRRHVIGSENWDLVDWKANSTAVSAIVDDTGEPPPGVNFTRVITLGVRRK